MDGVDFAYPWWLSWGHLSLAAVFLLALYFARRRPLARILFAALVLWGLGSFVVMKFLLGADRRGELPTAAFLADRPNASVIDLGAGTGRSSLMVLEGRPGTTITATDAFGASYAAHFRGDPNAATLEADAHRRLRQNFERAGVASRARIVTADMRKLPFEPAAFDGAISCYAVDHLPSREIPAALSEARRVLKPGAQFLLMVVHKDGWMRFAFGPLLLHSNFRSSEAWQRLLVDAGFQVQEAGARPMTLYFLVRNP